MSVYMDENGVTVDTSDTEPLFIRSFDTLKSANQNFHSDKARKKRVRLQDVNFYTEFDWLSAIHIERAYHAKVDGCSVVGPYRRGVEFYFCLYGSIVDVSVEGAKQGFFLGSGAAVDPATGEKLWPDGEHNNSASNQACVAQCRFHGQHDDAVGFVLEGGDNVVFEQTTVEGNKCKTGWKLAPRAPRGYLTLSHSWLEVPVATAIDFDGHQTWFEIRKLNLDGSKMPEVLLDCRGDQGSTVYFNQNNWPSVPKIILGRDTNVELGRNSFSDDEFWASVTRV